MNENLESDAIPMGPKGPEPSSRSDQKDGAPKPESNQKTNSTFSVKGNIKVVQIGTANNIHFGTVINNQAQAATPAPKGQPPKHKKVEVPESIRNNTTVVNEDMMNVIKFGDIGYTWKELGYSLRISYSDIQSLVVDFQSDGLNEMVFQLLLKWKELKGKDATVGKLACALDKIGRGDLALKLCS